VKERKSYITLVMISIILTTFAILFTIREINVNDLKFTNEVNLNNHKICQVVSDVTLISMSECLRLVTGKPQ